MGVGGVFVRFCRVAACGRGGRIGGLGEGRKGFRVYRSSGGSVDVEVENEVEVER